MFNDFFSSASTVHGGVEHTLKEIYNITKYSKNVFFGINLIWPDFVLDDSYDRYFLSWHTEQLDTHWLIAQAKQVHPKPILVAYDGTVSKTNIWPNNIQFVRFVTLHKQLNIAVSKFGVESNPKIPQYKFSSLSSRYSQYKKFITAFMLSNIEHDSMILTWHNTLGKDEDKHDHPVGFEWLDSLNLDQLEQKHLINFVDEFDPSQPIDNTQWKIPPFADALINLTNESYHYSDTRINMMPARYPGPYITEKTYKPILAGRPFVAVSQCETLKMLNELGFDTNFGWNNNYDSDCGDLTRIGKIFNTILEIDSTPIGTLFEQSISAVQHNLNHITSGNLHEGCEAINRSAQQVIEDFID